MKIIAAGLVLAALLTTAPAAAATGPPSIDAYLAEALDSTGVPGLAAVVTKGAEVVHATGVGHDSTGAPMTENTPMRIASVSKSFTAMAVMTLVDEGRIDLDEPVVARLPEFRMADPRAAAVTPRQLLNQTSGLSDRTVDIGALTEARSLAEYVSLLRNSSLAADPGTEWAYCNVNYDVAARLVEVVSGMPFADHLRREVFAPLGMADSTVGGSAADGYNSLFGVWVARPELADGPEANGAGGVVTTAADLGRWLVTQNGFGRQLVRPSSLDTMHTPPRGQGYAMGWAPSGDLLVHSGNLFTYNAMQAVDGEYGFAVMTNGAGLIDETAAVLDGLVALTRGRTPEVPGGDRQLIEGVLAALGLLAVALGVLGVVRARRWAARRVDRSRWWTAARLAPALLPAAVLALYPDLISVLTAGRAVSWAQLTYFAAPLSIVLVVAAAAGLAVVAARLVRLGSAT